MTRILSDDDIAQDNVTFQDTAFSDLLNFIAMSPPLTGFLARYQINISVNVSKYKTRQIYCPLGVRI